ncbi:MAG: hypothetical protein ACRDUA_00235 [Micromonosporaceae bacterium]
MSTPEPTPDRATTTVEPLRVMRWWWVFGGLMMAVLAGGLVIWWLFGEGESAGRGSASRLARADGCRNFAA